MPPIINAVLKLITSDTQPNKGPSIEYNRRRSRLLIESTVALISETVILLIYFFKTGVASPLAK